MIPAQKFRELVFQMLYSRDIGNSSDEQMLPLLSQELAIAKSVVRQAQQRVHTLFDHLADIDAKISKASLSYDFDRIQTVERNIIRLGAFELLFDDDIPPKVAISEAIRLSKKFSTKESAAFVNAILNALYQDSLGEHIDRTKLEQSAKDLSTSEKIAREASQSQQKTSNDD